MMDDKAWSDVPRSKQVAMKIVYSPTDPRIEFIKFYGEEVQRIVEPMRQVAAAFERFADVLKDWDPIPPDDDVEFDALQEDEDPSE